MKSVEEILAENKLIILFDGMCGFCDSCVDFVIRRDTDEIFKFASLQSELGQRLLRHFSLPTDSFDSSILIEDGRVFSYSTASLRIVRKLNRGWSLLYGFILVPVPLRDWAYRYFASHRYEWFGRSSSCRIPSESDRKRFLD